MALLGVKEVYKLRCTLSRTWKDESWGFDLLTVEGKKGRRKSGRDADAGRGQKKLSHTGQLPNVSSLRGVPLAAAYHAS